MYVCNWNPMHKTLQAICIDAILMYRICLVFMVTLLWRIGKVKPVCNDHLYNEIYYLRFIQ